MFPIQEDWIQQEKRCQAASIQLGLSMTNKYDSKTKIYFYRFV